MRAAVCSDVHGGLVSLEAVLAAAADHGVEELWFVGDLVAHGPQPAETITRLMGLTTGRFVRGNTDRYVLIGDLSGVSPVLDDPRTADDLTLLLATTAAHAWTRGAITAVGGYDWLAELPLEHRVELPDGTRTLLVHASPGRDDGPGIAVDATDQQLIEAGVTDADADLIFVGHTHVPVDRTVEGVRVINLGSVSVPATPERGAMWSLLEATDHGYRIERHVAAYDLGRVLDLLDTVHHPSASWLQHKLTATGRQTR